MDAQDEMDNIPNGCIVDISICPYISSYIKRKRKQRYRSKLSVNNIIPFAPSVL